MDQYIDNRQKEIFWNLLANPADKDASSLQSLERLVSDYPQSAVLQALAARAKVGLSVNRVAVYVEPRLLHKLINDPQNLPLVDVGNITDLTNIPQSEFIAQTTEPEPAAPMIDPYEALREPEPLAYLDEEDTAPVAEEQHTPDTVIGEEPEDVAEGPISAEGEEIVTEVSIAEQRFGEPIDEEPIDEIAEAPHVFNLPEQSEETEIKEPVTEDATISEQPVAVSEEESAENISEQPVENKFFTEELPVEQSPAITEEGYVEAPAVNEYHFSPRFPKPGATVTPEAEHQTASEPIEDEVYDEIVGIDDIGFKPVIDEPNANTAPEHRFSEPDTDLDAEEQSQQPAVQFHQPDDVPTEPVQDYREVKNEEEKLILGGIVGGDYLSFDKKLDELREASGYVAPKFSPQNTEQPPAPIEEKAPEPAEPAAEAPQTTSGNTVDSSNVSRYDDDNMPYSFLWWLDKTRKEHAANVRPYAEVVVPQQARGDDNTAGLKRADELQQQYFEHMVSHTSVNDVEQENNAENVTSKPEKKEDVIIERFIQSDPQIKPLSADKLDNENKAKRSSEDSNEVVTETLARIYADQMLYHKAIATYKKLILKFPEKSTYFAARIEELEKKTN